jgi:pilus assembly protein CpaC
MKSFDEAVAVRRGTMIRNLFMMLSILVIGLAQTAQAADVVRQTAPRSTAATLSQDASPVYQVPLYKSIIVPLRKASRRVSVGNPGVADIIVIRGDELYVVGKALGSTNVVVWDDAGRVFASFDIEVTHDLETLKARLFQLLPGEDIRVHSAQEQLILSGQVSSAARADAARELAMAFLPNCITAQSDAPGQPAGAQARRVARPDSSCKDGSVVNLMQVGGASQVMLKVTVAEMARSVVRRLDSNLNIMKFGAKGGSLTGGAVSGGAAFPDALDASGLLTPVQGALTGASPIGPPVHLFSPNTPTIENTGLYLSYLYGNSFIEAVLDISKRNGLAKILSEPTLTTLTGQEAQFLSGGEFPVPVPRGGASEAVTIEFKEFGVGLKFIPVVLDTGRINLTLSVTVSEISGDNAVILRSSGTTSTFAIPSLTKRSASSVVELGDGQTIGIAGLINDNVREFVQKFPVLGDIPVLGMLFRSQEYMSGQSELVIFVTPQLAQPIARHQVRLPTDTFVPPGDLAFYLLGKMESHKKRPDDKSPPPTSRTEMPKGSFGHDLGTNP